MEPAIMELQQPLKTKSLTHVMKEKKLQSVFMPSAVISKESIIFFKNTVLCTISNES